MIHAKSNTFTVLVEARSTHRSDAIVYLTPFEIKVTFG